MVSFFSFLRNGEKVHSPFEKQPSGEAKSCPLTRPRATIAEK